MKVGKRIAEGFHRAAGAVRRVLNTAHSKKEMIDLRRKKLEKLTGGKEEKPAVEQDEKSAAGQDDTPEVGQGEKPAPGKEDQKEQ